MMNLYKNETIKPAIDEITPADGAKERMLANIKRKAEAGKTKPISVSLAKWAAPLAACLIVAVITAAGVRMIPTLSQTQITSDPEQVGNPVRLVDSAAAFNEELGISVDAPEGSKNVQYRIVDDEIADISFVYNNTVCTLRASEKNGDFSGIDGTAVISELIDSENNAMLTTETTPSGEAFLKLIWSAGKTKYILSCPDRELNGDFPNIKTSDPDTYSHTEAANTVIDLYGLIK